MRNRTIQNLRSNELAFEKLELRQLFAVIATGYSSTHHLPQDSSSTVLFNLTGAPEILQHPEHGELRFDENDGTLTYHPDEGFTGTDTFRVDSSIARHADEGRTVFYAMPYYGNQDTTFSMRVWEPVFAVPDWALVRPGSSGTVNVIENDYVLREQEWGGVEWQKDAANFNIVDVSSDTQANVSISHDGKSLHYTPVNGFLGTEIVTYTMEDDAGHRSVASVTFEVSDRSLNGRYYFSEAHWQQQMIEGWLESYASSLTGGGYTTMWGVVGVFESMRLTTSDFALFARSGRGCRRG